MTPQQINEAIAKEMGWKPHPNGISYYKGNNLPIVGVEFIPNYVEDLNAMHEVEKTLQGEILGLYAGMLLAVVRDGFNFNATARQRAEAYLRTIGKWEE